MFQQAPTQVPQTNESPLPSEPIELRTEDLERVSGGVVGDAQQAPHATW